MDTCEKCGKEVEIGMWPFCPHGETMAYHPFIPFWDPHVATPDKWEDPKRGIYVDGLAKWNRVVRDNGMEFTAPKYDRAPTPELKGGFDRAFNKAAQDLYGGQLDLSSLRDDD
jgi:hypothetical protein